MIRLDRLTKDIILISRKVIKALKVTFPFYL